MFTRIVLKMLCLLPILGHASNTAPVKFSGFGTLGAVTSSTDEVGFKRDVSDPNYASEGEVNLKSLSMIGLQMNASFSDKIETVLQLVARDSPEQDHVSILRIAALNYEPTENWQLRLGRTPPRIFLLSDSRIVGYSNLWTMPVHEFYAPFIINYIDGVDGTYSINNGSGAFRSNISYGRSSVQIDNPVFGATSVSFDRAVVVNFEYDVFEWLLRFSWAQADKGKNWQELDDLRGNVRGLATALSWQEGFRIADDYTFEDGAVRFYSVGAAYDSGNISIRTEFGNIDSSVEIVPSVYSGYLSMGYRIGDFTPYAVLSKVHTIDSYSLNDPVPAPAAPLAALVTGFLDSSYNQNSATLGLRWDLALNKSLKVQWAHKSIYDGGYGLWARAENDRFPENDVDVDIVSVSFDFLF